MAVIPKDAIFSAENLVPDGYSFVSCVTTPKFQYEGFRLVHNSEIQEKYPALQG
jgi:predicted cupin superfamily sugar epimerase